MKQTKKLTKLLFILLILLIPTTIYFFTQKPTKQTQTTVTTPSITPTPTTIPAYYFREERIQSLKEELANDQKINPDVKAILVFESELIHEPILQGSDNEHYLYVDWQTGEYRAYGSLMMDAENQLTNDDMNTIIYGHYVYRSFSEDRTLMFTPIAELLQQENYEPNRYLALITNTDIRYYEIAIVYDSPLINSANQQYAQDDLQFNLTHYTQDYWQTYYNAMQKNSYYQTDVTLNYGDKLLTLQTCIEDNPDNRQIVVCKEIKRIQHN